MRYKVGDKVVLKNNSKKEDIEIARDIEKMLEKINRTVTIAKVLGEHYAMKEVRAHWAEKYVKGLAPEPKLKPKSVIITRFELMEL